MSLVFNIQHETDLSEYTTTVTGGGDLSQSGDAALAGTNGGLSVLIDDTGAIYGEKTFTQLAGTSYRLRFYIDPNSLGMGSGDAFRPLVVYDSSNSRFDVWLKYDGSNYQIRARVFDDNTNFRDTSYYNLTDAPHYVEVLVTYASGASANDGVLTLWIDGVQQESLTDVDLYNTSQPDSARLGAVSGLDATTSGTLYLDEFVLRDDDTEIGAAGTAYTQDLTDNVLVRDSDAFSQTDVLDDFNRANGSLGSNWTADPLDESVSAPMIVSNSCQNSIARNAAYWNPSSFGPACEISVRLNYVAFVDDPNATISLLLRLQNPG